MNKLTSLIFLISISIFGQTKSKGFSIDGNLKVYFVTELRTSKIASIVLLPNNCITDIDNSGNYKFENLKSGAYKIIVLDFNAKPKEFEFEVKSNSVSNFDLIVYANCEVYKETAILDIQNDKPRLLLISGIAPYVTTEDYHFAKKHQIIFQDFGDSPPAEECVRQYNQTVFDYLDKKFGKKWRAEVRDDVVGLK